jgi:hypothetical protein
VHHARDIHRTFSERVEMPQKSRTKRPVGHSVATPPRGSSRPGLAKALPLPHERDESTGVTAVEPDPVMVQAKRDIDAGMVDTDMRATPGLDAELRARMVPGPGGKPPKPHR